MMKAVLLDRTSEASVAEIPEPNLGNQEVLLRVGACGIFASDLHLNQINADEQSPGFDCAVDATGSTAVIEAAFRNLAPRSKLLLLGSPPTAASIAIHPRRVQRQDVTVLGTFSFSQEFAAPLELLQAGWVQAEPIVTHQFPMWAFAEAWDRASAGGDCIKVQVVPG